MGGGAERNVYDRLRTVRRAVRPIEAAQTRRLGRSLLSLAFRTPVLVLHTTGRRSGRERTTTLAYHEDADGSLLVVGGAGGQSRIPDWVSNLRASPRAAVTLDRQRFDVVGTEIAGHERQSIWPQLAAVWPQIDAYERRARRPVPVFRLTRTESAAS